MYQIIMIIIYNSSIAYEYKLHSNYILETNWISKDLQITWSTSHHSTGQLKKSGSSAAARHILLPAGPAGRHLRPEATIIWKMSLVPALGQPGGISILGKTVRNHMITNVCFMFFQADSSRESNDPCVLSTSSYSWSPSNLSHHLILWRCHADVGDEYKDQD